MAKQKGAPQNLISIKDRTIEEQQEITRKGGIASGKARREKKLLSQYYATMLAELYDVNVAGVSQKVSGYEFYKIVAKEILMRRDSASVSMLKEIREATEGVNSNIKVTGITLTIDKDDAAL